MAPVKFVGGQRRRTDQGCEHHALSDGAVAGALNSAAIRPATLAAAVADDPIGRLCAWARRERWWTSPKAEGALAACGSRASSMSFFLYVVMDEAAGRYEDTSP